LIGWPTSLETSVNTSDMLQIVHRGRLGRGLLAQAQGDGFVIVHPSEGFPTEGKGAGVADAIGDLLR
jgi:hypothetical protein